MQTLVLYVPSGSLEDVMSVVRLAAIDDGATRAEMVDEPRALEDTSAGDEVARARKADEAVLLGVIERAAKSDWRAAAWLYDWHCRGEALSRH